MTEPYYFMIPAWMATHPEGREFWDRIERGGAVVEVVETLGAPGVKLSDWPRSAA